MRGANEQSVVNSGLSVTHASVNEQMHCLIKKKKKRFYIRCQFWTASAPSEIYFSPLIVTLMPSMRVL